MFRRAEIRDVERISEIYDALHSREEAGRACMGWVRGVYPTRETARAAVDAGDMFVLEEEGRVVAAARINRIQVPEYANAAWRHPAPDAQVMVLHTLVVDPDCAGRGCGTRFVDFYESYARAQSCPFLRMDTNARNRAARALYKKLGYEEVSIVPCAFNGIPGVQLVCLEKKLED